MNGETHAQLAGFIWSICNLLRGPYKRNEYRKVILPLTVLRRFECLLEPTRQAALDEFKLLKIKPERVSRDEWLWVRKRQWIRMIFRKWPGRLLYRLLRFPIR
jgi:type I restriction-modification system DNA methylase subunit